MAIDMKRDFLRNSPGFLAAIDQVLAEGFFENFDIQLSSLESGLNSMTIAAAGFIPDSQVNMRDGVKPYVDVKIMFENIKSQINDKSLEVVSHSCTIESTNWDLWDDKGMKIIGSLGNKIQLSLIFQGRKQQK